MEDMSTTISYNWALVEKDSDGMEFLDYYPSALDAIMELDLASDRQDLCLVRVEQTPGRRMQASVFRLDCNNHLEAPQGITIPCKYHEELRRALWEVGGA